MVAVVEGKQSVSLANCRSGGRGSDRASGGRANDKLHLSRHFSRSELSRYGQKSVPCHFRFPSPLSPFPFPSLSFGALTRVVVDSWVRASSRARTRVRPYFFLFFLPPKGPNPLGFIRSFVRSFVRFTLPFEKGATAFLPCSFLFPCAPSPPSLRHTVEEEVSLRCDCEAFILPSDCTA